MKRNRRGTGIVGIVLMLALAACSASTGSSSTATPSGSPGSAGAASTAPARAKIVVGVSAAVLAFAPLYIAKEKGYWEDENLDVELTSFNSGTESQQALLGDAIDLGAGGYTEPINLTSQGAPTVIFASAQEGLAYTLMAKKEITDVSQLTGKTLGVSKAGSLSDQVTHIALNKEGFDPTKVTYQACGGAASCLAALEAGVVDGTILSSPTDELAKKAGFNPLIDVAKELPGFAYEVLYAKKATIEAKHDVFVRFMKGYIKATQYMTDPANKDDVLQIASQAMNRKVSDLEITYDEHIADFPPTGAPGLEGIQKALDGTKQFGDVSGADKLSASDLHYPDLQQEAAAALGIK
jgi:NitT/TauT family transport system substrate-binding protein